MLVYQRDKIPVAAFSAPKSQGQELSDEQKSKLNDQQKVRSSEGVSATISTGVWLHCHLGFSATYDIIMNYIASFNLGYKTFL